MKTKRRRRRKISWPAWREMRVLVMDFRALRLRRGWSQKRVGNMLGVSRQYISQIELFQLAPSRQVLEGMTYILYTCKRDLLDTEAPVEERGAKDLLASTW